MQKKSRFLTQYQSRMFAQKLLELGNLAIGGLVVSQLVPGTEPLKVGIAGYGLIVFVTLYATSYILTRGGDEQ